MSEAGLEEVIRQPPPRREINETAQLFAYFYIEVCEKSPYRKVQFQRPSWKKRFSPY
jgi:hypothetical protein